MLNPSILHNSIFEQRFSNIKNPTFDIYYEIVLSCNKNYHLCRQIVSFGKIRS